MLRTRAQTARDNAADMQAASNALTSTIAVSVDAVRPGIVSLYGKFSDLGAADDEAAGILEEYASAVDELARRADSVRDDCESAWKAIWARRADALGPVQEFFIGWALDWDEVRTVGISFSADAGNDPVWIDTRAWQTAIDDFTSSRAAYRALRKEREALDADTADRLHGVKLFARLSDEWKLGPRGTSAIVDAWAGDTSSVTAEALVAVKDPILVAQVWASLTEEQQNALIAGSPLLLGGLAGLPPWARVAANRLNAKTRIREITRVLDAQPDPYRPLTDDEMHKLEAERDYLQAAANGKIGLYYYDHRTDSIIEMIGEITPETTEINTYVPGTFTSAFSFYDNGVQQVGRWLNAQDPGVVTFVWKVGAFPGETPATGGAHIFPDILEADDVDFTLEKGKQLADFQAELRASVTQKSADFNGVGHSWGLAAVTSAEVAGADFDTVVSLAGAGMPSEWEAQAATDYAHYSYVDVLSMAQESGLVWEGRNPGDDPSFDSHIYARDGDFDLPLATGVNPQTGMPSQNPVPTIPASTVAFDNHNLIASDNTSNRKALREMLWELTR